MAPGGTVRLSDKLYIEREADNSLKRQILRPGSITTIRAARQTGKSSLLVRGIQHARQHGAKVVSLDLQRVDREHLNNPNAFLRYLADFMVRKLHLDTERVEKIWQGTLGPQDKLTYLMEDHILGAADTPIILTIDEADRLVETNFHTDFFGLIRSWHNSTAYDEVWEKLNIVMVISTEPYLLIANINQSPFNVGLKLYLEDFTLAQVTDLNRRHGEPIGQNGFDQFMTLLHGHPYLTRKALYTLVTGSMTWDELHRGAASDSGPFSDHLRHQLWLLRDEAALQTTLKEIIRQNRASNEMALFRLLRAGLVRGAGTLYTCRCELYQRYFEDRL
ncbi:MAG TPA: AAA-like domain-containing protein [Chloroflexota bacterium]|nr:AAA-like domain-containing protein [Chloroflexota bacterium]HUM69600.1 AAA-like domain-containing protein [Chloroflexota bacterium]